MFDDKAKLSLFVENIKSSPSIVVVKAVLEGTWESTDTWGGMDTGMVEMAPMTNMPEDVAETAIAIANQIYDGKLDIFPGKSMGDLLGMQDYLPGLDAMKP